MAGTNDKGCDRVSPRGFSMTSKLLLATAFALGTAFCGVSIAQAAEQPYDAAAVAAAQAQGKPVILHVTAPWCSTCAAQKPIVDALIEAPRYKQVTVYDVDFDSQKAVLRKYGVTVQSTFVAFKGDREVARSSGDTNKASVEKLFDKTS